MKPDLVAYNQQKAIAMGQAPGSLVGFNPTGGSSEIAVTSEQQRMAAENLYRDANTLIYGDSKPSEDAIDRVVSKINKEYVYLFISPALRQSFHSLLLFILSDHDSDILYLSIDKKGKFSRKRLNEEEGDITYINEHNRVFNKKVNITLGNTCSSPILTGYFFRLHVITTSILPRSGQVSSEVQLYNCISSRFFVQSPTTLQRYRGFSNLPRLALAFAYTLLNDYMIAGDGQ